MLNMATLLTPGFRKCHQSIPHPKNGGIPILFFLSSFFKKYIEKIYISGNTAMPNLATLLTLGFLKCYKSISC